VIARAEVELGRRAADLAGRLPDALAPLARIAYNYRWCWYPDGNDVFPSLEQAPRAWLAGVRASMRTLASGFCTGRMLDDYTERIYAPSTSPP
jgi:uncharacterized protein DUF3417